MGVKRDPVPPNTFVERLFKPSVVWQDESGNTSLAPITPPDAEHNSDIIGGSGTKPMPSAHVIMAVTHHGYNVLTMPSSGGIITVPCEEKDA